VSTGPLAGVTVVDFTRVLAGPFCTLVLSDLGARVIKVEHPDGGDLARSIGPWFGGKSGYQLSVNRGKESIALDLKRAGDLAVARALLARADVLVENFRPGVMDRLGLGWEAVHARHPGLIYAATSGFGHTGPYAEYAAFDLVAQAMGGVMSLTGHPGAPPTRVGTSIGDIAAGLYTAIGVNAALVHRARTGEGLKVDVAMLDCQVAIGENAIARHFAGETPGPLGARHPAIAPFDAFPTRDRPVIIAVGDDAGFRRLCAALDRPALADDPRFTSNAVRLQHHEALKEALSKRLAARPAGEWVAILRAAGLPCGPINTVAEVVADPQVAARNMIVEVDDPTAGRVSLFGCPIKLSAFADPHERPTAPDLDADRARILAELALTPPAAPVLGGTAESDVPADPASELPDVGAVLVPVLARVPRARQPLLLAIAERLAAARYRAWADRATDPARRQALQACAAREEEIAARVEGLDADAGAVQRDILMANPDLHAVNRDLFADRPLADQFTIQARGERLGAATWKAFARDAADASVRATYRACAELEEASAVVLESILAAGCAGIE
jgi:CoA:oxalate CoA-transferase